MLKYLSAILIILIVLSACKKQKDHPVPEKQNLIFTGYPISGDEKSTLEDCNNPKADYAVIIIDGLIYRPAVFYLGGIPYTGAIKYIPGTYLVSQFLLMNDAGTPGDLEDDFIVQAIPQSGSNYAQYVSSPVSFEIQVAEYEKTEIAVDVICFNESDYEKFGFDWFLMNEITVRSQTISGNICVENMDDYVGSLYEGQSSGLNNQMPAIFTIDVYRNGAYLLSYNNESSLGEDPLEIEYPDHDHASDQFDFKLSVLVKSGSGFSYELIETWSFDNDNKLDTGDNEIVDFVLGDCLPGDYQFPAYTFPR